MTHLEEMLQAKVKELDGLRAKINESEVTKQKLLQQALEVQGAAKVLVELVNEEKAKSSIVQA
jgi:hypothetical protein